MSSHSAEEETGEERRRRERTARMKGRRKRPAFAILIILVRERKFLLVGVVGVYSGYLWSASATKIQKSYNVCYGFVFFS